MTRKLWLLFAFGVFLALFSACEDDSDCPVCEASSETQGAVSGHDTVFVYDHDTLYVYGDGDGRSARDSVSIKDSTVVRDSSVVRDSVNVIDSLAIRDSVNIIDSLNLIDSVVVRDSLVMHDLSEYIGDCDASSAGKVVPYAVDGTNLDYFICDDYESAWRIATAVEKDSFFISQSKASDFVDIAEVYSNLGEDETLIFLLRHAERGDDYSRTGKLNTNGINQSKELGARLVGDDEFYLGASEFVRAHQTGAYIAEGRNQVNTESDTLPQLNDDWYVKNADAYSTAKNDHGGGWKVASKWAFQGYYAECFYDLKLRSVEMVEKVLVPAALKSGKRVSLFVSHDILMVPFVVNYSNKAINLKYYESNSNKQWLNYLAGVAIVLKPDGSRRYVIVRGLKSGFMS